MSVYEETVRTPRFMVVGGYAIAMLLLLVGLGIVLYQGRSVGDRVMSGAILALVAALMFCVTVNFDRLRIRVEGRRVSFRFGLVGKAVDSADIIGVEVERYRWIVFGGWGVRLSTKKRRAYSVPGYPSGVALRMGDGSRWHISSADPEGLASAIQRATHSGATESRD